MARYWFPAKRFGWGWGPPSTWEGWAVLIAVIALTAAAPFVFPPVSRLPLFLLYIALVTLGFLGVCLLKGEPPRWRWGDKDRGEPSD
ncbi:MAG: hypothetical protein JO111_08265 [Caulobacteraceae bacterium]|nr:hypothetical protein [Caulobacteraceae bacterium]